VPEEPEAGDWSAPDAGVDPEDYVKPGVSGKDRPVNGDGEPDAPSPEVEASPADPLSPGRSMDDDDGDAVEPNEPA
jgi:hypothetical protein